MGDGWIDGHTNSLVVCIAASLKTSIAVQIALGGIVGCKDCFGERTLDEGLVDDEAESAVVRVRGQSVGNGRVAACKGIRGEGLNRRVPLCVGTGDGVLVLVCGVRDIEADSLEVVDCWTVGVVRLVGGEFEQILFSDGGVEALASAQGRGSTQAQESSGEKDWFDHCRLVCGWYRSVMRR
jgi:hypothetical protein